MRQYSADQVDITWKGLDFREGLATGTFITETRNAPSWTMKPQGPGGKMIRVYNPNRSGAVSVVIDQESKLHRQLRTIAKADRNPATRNQVAAMIMADASSKDRTTYKNAYIVTDPDESRGIESGTFTWSFHFETIERDDNEDPSNLVGA
jgi:hypothetical protein